MFNRQQKKPIRNSAVITLLTAVIIGILVVSLPLGFFFISYKYETGRLDSMIEYDARRIERFIISVPEGWQYQRETILSILSHSDTFRNGILLSLHTMDNKPIIAWESEFSFPSLKTSRFLYDAGLPVAKLEMEASLWPLLKKTTAIGLVSAVIGGLLFVLIAWFPLQSLRATEEELIKSEESLREAQRIAKIGSFEHGQDPRWSREVYRILGYDTATFPLSFDDFKNHVFPEDLPIFTNAIERLLKTGKTQEIEYRIHDQRKTVKTIKSIIYPVINRAGTVEKFFGTIMDITEQKALQQELITTQKMETTGRLVGGIAHDINNLLMIMLTNVQFLKRFSGQNNDALELLGDIEHAVNISSSLVNKFFTFSGRVLSLKKEASDLSAFLKEFVLHFSFPHNIQCELDIREDLGVVLIDRTLMDVVLNNLLSNAVEAMPNGGLITISASAESAFGQNNPLSPGKYIKMSITDTGTGIAQEHIHRIFDPYFSTKNNVAQKGLGLGLTVCYSIVKHHNGLITVESSAGMGTTFHVYLPQMSSDPDQTDISL